MADKSIMDASSLPPSHRRVKTSDPDWGSFVYLPSPEPQPAIVPTPSIPSHELARVANAQESILIVNDYRHVQPQPESAPLLKQPPATSLPDVPEFVVINGAASVSGSQSSQNSRGILTEPSAAGPPKSETLPQVSPASKVHDTAVDDAAEEDILALKRESPLSSSTGSRSGSIVLTGASEPADTDGTRLLELRAYINCDLSQLSATSKVSYMRGVDDSSIELLRLQVRSLL